MSKTPDETKNTDVSVWNWVAALLVVAAIWGASGYAVHKFSDTEPAQDKATPGVLGPRGTFGDMFGAVNALFSGLAFATLIYTVMLQRHELKLQRQELEETRKELAGQREQMEAQANTFRKQAFEDTFFKLLDLQRKLVEEAQIGRGTRIQRGRECFRALRESLFSDYGFQYRFHKDSGKIETSLLENIATTEAIKESFKYGHESYLTRYFETLANSLEFVLRSETSNQNFYINLIRDQLSKEELIALFYMCKHKGANDKGTALYEMASLFSALSPDELLDPSHVFMLKPSAFGHRYVQTSLKESNAAPPMANETPA